MSNFAATVSSNEAARKLGVTRNTVVKAVRDGRLKGEKVGRDWRIEVESLASYRAATEVWESFRAVQAERQTHGAG